MRIAEIPENAIAFRVRTYFDEKADAVFLTGPARALI